MRLCAALLFISLLCVASLAHADTNAPEEALALALQKAAPQLLTDDGEVPAAFDAGIIAPAADIPNFPSPPDSALRSNLLEIEQDGPYPFLHIEWLKTAKLGGAFSVQGSGEYVQWLMFTSDSKGSHLAPTPDVFDGGSCEGCDVGLYFGLYKRWPVAISESDDPKLDGTAKNRDIISVQSWNGTAWSDQAAIEIGLEYQINPVPDFVSCLAQRCDDVSRLAYGLALKFFRDQTAQAVSIEITPAERTQFTEMERLADADQAAALGGSGPLDSLPIIKGEKYPAPMAPYYAFDTGAVIFPALLDGELVIGRIGHCTIGWRVDTAWHIGFWKLEGAELEPIGAAVFSVEQKPKITSITDDWLFGQ